MVSMNSAESQEQRQSWCSEQGSSGQSNMKKPVSILITWDIDPAAEVSTDDMKEALMRTRWLLGDHQISSTFFLPAIMAEQFGPEVACFIQDGHEIGCHGFTHGDEEDYDRMTEDMQCKHLCKATETLRRLTGRNVFSFRGPRMKSSHITQKILVELGYSADCSVASQRMDFVSSNLVNVGWILAPRLPYRPSHRSAFRRGQQNIWVVPLSALVLPFISSALYIFKVRVMKLLFRTLYLESQRTGKPIMYLVHPYEFAPYTGTWKPEGMSIIQRVRTHGFLLRDKFYEKNHEKRFGMNQELFKYMKSFPNIRFRTVRDYVCDELESQAHVS